MNVLQLMKTLEDVAPLIEKHLPKIMDTLDKVDKIYNVLVEQGLIKLPTNSTDSTNTQ